MHHIAPLITDLTIMLSLAAVVTLLFQRIHQPVVLGYLITGMILGPYTTPHTFVSDIPNIKILSELGVIFLMFSLGLEFSFHKLMRVGFSASITGSVEFVLMLIIGYMTGKLLGWSHYDSIFLGSAICVSSTTIIIKALDELKLKTKRFAELIFGILIVEDLLAILLLVALSSLIITKQLFSVEMAYAIVQLILVVSSWFLLGYFAVPFIFRQIARHINQETLTILSVALCLFLVSVAAYFDYSPALGAFIMGSILAETLLIHRIEEVIRPIRDIFAAVFFMSVGMLIDPVIMVDYWHAVVLIAFITIFGKLLTAGTLELLTGQSLTTSIRVGFSIAQVGEFSFIIAALGAAMGVTSNKLYPIIVAVSLVTTFTTPYLIRLSGKLSVALEKYLPVRVKYFLSSYSAWVYRSQASVPKKTLIRMVSVRLFLNGIIVAIIFTFVHQIIFPSILLNIDNIRHAKIISFFVALGAASPFIWGMLSSFKRVYFPEYAKTYLNPAVFIIWLLTLTEVAFLSIVYFHTISIAVSFIVIAVIFFAISYKRLETSYHWFEEQLVKNVKLKANKLTLYEELAPWDSHFVEIEVGNQSTLIGKTLRESQIRQQYGVNIVAIYRSREAILMPRGDEKIMLHDKLVILGNDEQIDAFKEKIELGKDVIEETDFLENVTLKSIFLSKNNKLIGKTIQTSTIRESVNGIVVGLERDNMRILNPNSETILKEDDLLFIVGNTEKLKKLNN